MSRTVLITGGAGFIGSHLADNLLQHGDRVRVLDSLSEQVHGPEGDWPAYLDKDVQRMHGDIRDAATVDRALEGVDAVVHLAAMVGVGQSMYQVQEYTSVNQIGTAVLLERLMRHKVERLVVASSMSIYGEGLYFDDRQHPIVDATRSIEQMKAGNWEVRGRDGLPLSPAPTPEHKPAVLASNYALSKYAQERMALVVGPAYGIPTVALRFFNVYGPRQALSNPYTGVLAIFASRLLNEKPPIIFEDGLQQRDFVSVYDVARACRLAITSSAAPGQVFNIGSGDSHTILEIAQRLAKLMGKSHITPTLSGAYRVGDIRHCFADISRARRILGYEPQVTLDTGMKELAEWLIGQAANDRVEQAHAELAERGLTV